MFKVIKHQQHPLLAQEIQHLLQSRTRLPWSSKPKVQRFGHHRGQLVRAAHLRQGYEVHAVRKHCFNVVQLPCCRFQR